MKQEKNSNDYPMDGFQLPVRRDTHFTENEIQISNCVLAHLYSVWNALDGRGTLFATKTGGEKERIVGTVLYVDKKSPNNKATDMVFPVFFLLEKESGELLLSAGAPLEDMDSTCHTLTLETSVFPLGIFADFKGVSEGCARFRYDPFFGISIKRKLPLLSERTVNFLGDTQAIILGLAENNEVAMTPYFLVNRNTVNKRVEDFFKENYALDVHPIATDKFLDSDDFDKNMYYIQKGE